MEPGEPLLLTMPEAAQRLGISFYLLKCETRSGRLGSLKIGSRRMIPITALDDYIKLCLAEEEQERLNRLVVPDFHRN